MKREPENLTACYCHHPSNDRIIWVCDNILQVDYQNSSQKILKTVQKPLRIMIVSATVLDERHSNIYFN
jgi:hypothetical protein